MKRIVWITVALVAMYLLFKGSPFYEKAIAGITQSFRKVYGALTTGKP